MIGNYDIKKVKHIFVDGESSSIDLCTGDRVDYRAIIKDDKVMEFLQKGYKLSKPWLKVNKNHAYVKDMLNYFINNDYNLVIDYRQ